MQSRGGYICSPSIPRLYVLPHIANPFCGYQLLLPHCLVTCTSYAMEQGYQYQVRYANVHFTTVEPPYRIHPLLYKIQVWRSSQNNGDGFVIITQMDIQSVDPSDKAKFCQFPKHSKHIIILRHLMAGLKNGRKDRMSTNPMLLWRAWWECINW